MADTKSYGYAFYDPLIREFLSDIKKQCEDNLISLVSFGSIARGKGKKESDIDLLIILRDASHNHYDRLKPFVDIELRMRKSPSYKRYLKEGLMPCFSYLIFSKAEADENHYIFLDMIEEAIILFDKNDYFRKRMAALKKRLSVLGSKKISLEDGTWYWDLKPDLKLGEEFVL